MFVILLIILSFIGLFINVPVEKLNNKLDNIVKEIIDENITDKDTIPEQINDISNANNKKIGIDIPNVNTNKKIIQLDKEGNFDYGVLNGLYSGNKWGQDGAKVYTKSLSDINPTVSTSIKFKDLSYQNNLHYKPDGSVSKPDIANGRDREKYKYMNIAYNQLRNAQQNSYKNNISVENGVDKNLLVYSKSKLMNPNFTTGYHEYTEKLNVTDSGINNEIIPEFDRDLIVDSEKQLIKVFNLKI